MTHRSVSRRSLRAGAAATVRRQITNYISALRGVLAPAGDQIRLLAREPGYIALIPPQTVDTDRFSILIGKARAARAGQDYQIAADRRAEALELWRGDALDGLNTRYLRQRTRALEGERRDATLKQVHGNALAGRLLATSAAYAAGAGSGPRHQLPADTGAFTGRERELGGLLRLAERAESGRCHGAAVICALDGWRAWARRPWPCTPRIGWRTVSRMVSCSSTFRGTPWATVRRIALIPGPVSDAWADPLVRVLA
jgi:hypothetical protein